MRFEADNSDVPVSAILDADGNQLFTTLGIMSLSCSSSKSYAQHELENGENMTDHAIDLQDRVNVTVILSPDDYIAVYREIKNLFNERTNFTIQSRVEIYTNMFLETMPHDESAAMVNTVALQLPFVKQKIGKTEFKTLPPQQVANQSDADTVDSGNKQPQEARTVLTKLFGGFL